MCCKSVKNITAFVKMQCSKFMVKLLRKNLLQKCKEYNYKCKECIYIVKV